MDHSHYFSILTPQGRGAIAVIEVGGDQIDTVLDECFLPVAQNPIAEISRAIIYGIWKSTSEDLLLVRSGLNVFEIQCHGSQAIITAIIDDLKDNGVLAKQPDVPAKQPADSALQSSEVFRDEIQTLMLRAPTERVALLLLKQWTLFPDAVIQLATQLSDESTAKDASETIATMLSHADFGLNFHRTRSIVLSGLPNAGKSSLLNCLLGFSRAIVNPMAGTTRDVVSELSAIDGWPVEFSDTAGLRDATGAIEKIGVKKAQERIQIADVVIAVIDAADEKDAFELPVSPDIVALNKIDLVNEAQHAALSAMLKRKWPNALHVATSAATGDGIPSLIEQIGRQLCPQLPTDGAPFPTTQTQVDWLRGQQA